MSPTRRPPRRPFRWWSALLLGAGLLAAAGCRPQVQAPGDPVAAVRAQAQALREDDLLRYTQLSLPPALFEQLRADWERRRQQPVPATPASQRYDRAVALLADTAGQARLKATAQTRLNQFRQEVNGQWPLAQTTLKIFAKGVLQAQDELGDDQRALLDGLVTGFLDHADPAELTDPQRMDLAIAELARTSRRLPTRTWAQWQQLPFERWLAQAGIALRGLKNTGKLYGMDVDAALAGVQAEVVEGGAERARLAVSYPMFGRRMEFEMDMERHDGRWYSADAIAAARRRLADAPVVR